jgi:uncharacterized protein (TIGR00369 family)
MESPTPDAATPDAVGDPGVDFAQQVLDTQPFSRLLGARIAAFGPGEVVLEVAVRPDLRQQNGFLHGGVLSYAADNALTFAGGSALGPEVLTAGFSISYARPARGVLLRARATVVHAGQRQAVCRCDLLDVDADGSERLCAVAQGTVVPNRRAPPAES